MEDYMWDAYRNAKATVDAFERMFQLEQENTELKRKLKEHEDRIDGFFKGQQESIGRTISALVSK